MSSKSSQSVRCFYIQFTGTEVINAYPNRMQVNSEEWFAYLEDDEVTQFVISDDLYYGDDFLCTVIKTKRKTGNYWYARIKINTKQGTRYLRQSLGKSKDVTLQQLWDAAQTLRKREFAMHGYMTRQT
jgi:uncharacterized protein YneR